MKDKNRLSVAQAASLLNASEQIIIQIVDFDRLIHNGLKPIANGRQWPGND